MQFHDRVYGDITLEDPCAVAIIQSPAFDRLWRIKQNGPFSIADPRWTTSRAEHSIGVYHLLRMFGASREEQLAGLVHDANHLAFSHLVDWLLGDAATQEQHDHWFAHNPHLALLKSIVETHGLDSATVMDYARFSLLEQPAPALCADRIDYTFRDGMCAEQVSTDDVQHYLTALQNHGGIFAMNDAATAERFSRLSIDLHIIRESNWGNGIYITVCKVLRRAFEKGLVEKGDFLVDDERIYEKMRSLAEAELFFAWEQSGAPLIAGTPEDFHLQSKCKIRIIDPYVLVNGNLMPVSTLRPGLARLHRHYRALRENVLHMKYPEAFASLARL